MAWLVKGYIFTVKTKLSLLQVKSIQNTVFVTPYTSPLKILDLCKHHAHNYHTSNISTSQSINKVFNSKMKLLITYLKYIIVPTTA